MLFRHSIKMHRYPVPQRAECYMYEHCLRSTFRSFCGDPFCKVLGFAVRKLNMSQITPVFKKLTKRFFYTTILQFRTSGLRSPTHLQSHNNTPTLWLPAISLKSSDSELTTALSGQGNIVAFQVIGGRLCINEES